MKIFINEANRLSKEDTSEGEVKWESPSNIAIVKYWGKYGNQFPSNPSFSFTLSAANTKTSIKYRKKKGNGISIHFNFEGKEKESFKTRIVRFLSAIQEYFPFINQLHLDIESENSFPHSSGIASSASGMSALALCLCDIEKQMFPGTYSEQEFRQKASFISRLGSGSACRSLFPIASVWGETTSVTDSSNYFGIGAAELVHPDFQTFHDDILIVSKAKKSISSSVGHELMKTNRYATERFSQANDHMSELMHAVSSGDIEKFGMLAEKEALVSERKQF